MHGAAGFVTFQPGQAESFGNNALTGKCRISVQQDGQHLDPVHIFELVLFGAGLAQNNRIYRF